MVLDELDQRISGSLHWDRPLHNLLQWVEEEHTSWISPRLATSLLGNDSA